MARTYALFRPATPMTKGCRSGSNSTNQKHMKSLLLPFLFLILATSSGESQSDRRTNDKLEGTWVKTTHSPDTLEFRISPNYTSFVLTLGDGSKGHPGGPYEFKTIMSVMMIHWVLSSNGYDCPTVRFNFDQSGNLSLSNFYSAVGEGEILKFRRIK